MLQLRSAIHRRRSGLLGDAPNVTPDPPPAADRQVSTALVGAMYAVWLVTMGVAVTIFWQSTSPVRRGYYRTGYDDGRRHAARE